MMNKIKDFFAIVFCILCVGWLIWYFNLPRTDGCQDLKVVEKLACNAGGTCKVKFSDGTTGILTMPAPNLEYTICPGKDPREW